MFNRVYTIKPRLPRKGRHTELDMIAGVVNRTFGQLTLIQYLLVRLDLGNTTRLPRLLEQYPQAKPPELHMFVVFGEVFGVFRLLEGFWLVFLGH